MPISRYIEAIKVNNKYCVAKTLTSSSSVKINSFQSLPNVAFCYETRFITLSSTVPCHTNRTVMSPRLIKYQSKCTVFNICKSHAVGGNKPANQTRLNFLFNHRKKKATQCFFRVTALFASLDLMTLNLLAWLGLRASVLVCGCIVFCRSRIVPEGTTARVSWAATWSSGGRAKSPSLCNRSCRVPVSLTCNTFPSTSTTATCTSSPGPTTCSKWVSCFFLFFL